MQTLREALACLGIDVDQEIVTKDSAGFFYRVSGAFEDEMSERSKEDNDRVAAIIGEVLLAVLKGEQ